MRRGGREHEDENVACGAIRARAAHAGPLTLGFGGADGAVTGRPARGRARGGGAQAEGAPRHARGASRHGRAAARLGQVQDGPLLRYAAADEHARSRAATADPTSVPRSLGPFVPLVPPLSRTNHTQTVRRRHALLPRPPRRARRPKRRRTRRRLLPRTTSWWRPAPTWSTRSTSPWASSTWPSTHPRRTATRPADPRKLARAPPVRRH